MKFVAFLALSVLALAAAKPSHHKNAHIKRTLTGLLRKMRTADANCTELSAAFGALARHSDELDSLSMIMEMDAEQRLTDNQLITLRRRILGFDIVNDDEMRELYTCDIVAVSTLSQLKDKLVPLIYNSLHLAYNYLVLSLPIVKNALPPGNELDLLNALESAGIFGADPEGAEWISVVLNEELYKVLHSGYVPEPPFPGSNQAKCTHVTIAFAKVLRENYDQESVDVIKKFTGVDLSSQQDVRSLICALIDGSGWFDVISAIEDHGVFRQLYKSVYPLLVQYVPMGREFLEDNIESLEGLQLNMNSGSPFDQKTKKSVKDGVDVKREIMAKATAKAKANVLVKAKRSYYGVLDDEALQQQLEQLSNYIDQVPNYVDYGNYGNYGGSYGGSNYGGYGGGFGGDYGSYYSGTVEEDVDIDTYLTTMRLTVDFLRELENSGLLSLVDDL